MSQNNTTENKQVIMTWKQLAVYLIGIITFVSSVSYWGAAITANQSSINTSISTLEKKVDAIVTGNEKRDLNDQRHDNELIEIKAELKYRPK